MNRIYRRVWNRQLNALVVASELATGDSGGSAARDPRAFLLMPTTLALALLCVLASGHAGASESNQSLRDLQALAAKYTQPMPVKVDAEVALAAAASQAQSSPAISADARVGLQLSTASLPVVRDVLPASVQVKLAANTAPKQVAVPRLAADVRANANIGLGGAQVASIDAGAKAAAGISGAPAGALRGLKASVDGALDSKLKVAGHQIDAQGQVKATAAITLPAKEELPGETHDRAITAAFDAGAAGKVRVQAPNGQEVVADRNLKLAGQATVAAQNSALGVGGLVGSAVGAAGNAVGGALNGTVGTVGSAVGGALNGTVGSVGGAVGGTLNNTVGAVGGALNGTVGSVGGTVGGALNGTVGSVGGAVGGTLNGTVGTVGGAVGGALNGTVGSVGGAVGGTLNNTVGAVGGALNGAVGTVGGAVGGALNGTVGSVGGAVGGTLNNTVGAVGGALNGTVGTVGGAVGGALNGTVGSVGGAVGGTLNNTVGAVGGALNGAVGSVGGAVGGALNGTVGSVGGAVGGTVGSVGTAVGGTLNNTVGSVGGLLNGATGSGTGLGGLLGNTLGNVGSAVGNLLNGNLNGTLGNLGSAVGGLVGGTLGGLGLTKPSAIPPTSPKAPAPADPNAGLIIGTGGLVGNVGQLIGPTTTSLFGGDGYLSNGNLKLSNANVMQTYSTVNVLGLPVVNLSPVGSTLNGLGGAATGGSSHLTLIGGVTSDSYIYNINNGNPGGLLGLLLPKDSPAWAAKCLDVALADISCWAVNAAQDYQVLMGDGAFANGSKEVVIGANARHELPKVDANVAFPGDGVNDPSNPTGVPTADYAARMGHSVIVGDSAVGTANGQTLLGAEATSNQANSVALGYRSAALRGAQASYSAYGLTAPQVSAGEVSVGTAGGGERQITNVAAGSVNTDAVNVAQLKGAISLINGVADAAVTYDLDAGGNPNYRRVTLGAGTGTTTIGNLAGGAVTTGSLEAVNGGQLAATNAAIASFFGGRAAFDPASGAFTAPLFEISTISTGGAIAKGLYENATDAFAAVDGSLVNLNTQITDIRNGGTRYLRVNSTGTEALATGADSIAVGTNARATAANSIAVGAGSLADRANSVSIGAAGAERQVTNMAAGTAATDAVNLGQLQASEQGALRYDLNGDGSVNYASATLGQTGTATTLRNLGPGQVSATSSEAINGAQLFAANQAVATHLGGGAAVNASGVLTAPTYSINNVAANGTVTKGSYNDVGTAFDAVSNSLANVADQTGEIDKLAVKYDVDGSGNVLNSVTLTGTGTGAVKITNVAAGSILAGSSDAITGDQLFNTNSTIANYFGGTTAYNGTTNVWTAPKFSISSIATDGTFTSGDYNNVTAAFTAVDGSLKVLNQRITNGGGGSAYLAVNSTAAAATAAGAEAVAVGPQASAAGANSVAVGNGASASAGNSVALGAGSVASVGAQSGYTGAYGQTGASNSAGEVSIGSTGSERKITHVADGSDTYDATNVGQLKNGVNYAIDESKKYTDQKIQNITNVELPRQQHQQPGRSIRQRCQLGRRWRRLHCRRCQLDRAGQWFAGAGRQLGGAGCGFGGEPGQHGLGGCRRCRTPGGQRGRRFAGHRCGQRAPAAGLAAGHDPLRHHGERCDQLQQRHLGQHQQRPDHGAQRRRRHRRYRRGQRGPAEVGHGADPGLVEGLHRRAHGRLRA